ncbi:hypothetical protein CTZ27_20785 [Streptomyces griseocarneus]|nr:hypothetical protein CTZ27_20785 [Streptomyces griseocarneus]
MRISLYGRGDGEHEYGYSGEAHGPRFRPKTDVNPSRASPCRRHRTIVLPESRVRRPAGCRTVHHRTKESLVKKKRSVSRRTAAALLASSALAAVTLAGQASAVTPHHSPAPQQTVTIKTSETRYAPFALNRNESVSSDTATLVMQPDGNLVVYDEFGRARWASNTVGQGWSANLQGDGNFVVYTRSGRAVWDSHTAGHPGSRLAVQDDGNVVIYDGSQAIWNTRTAH